ncbi:hypothetical protein [Natrarchaeobius oligotrophus]|uniref:hypothetical protein n=1 Tax=Natrarchaeobius oligotrophus TaxID=3455743 RepID=UPI001A9FB327|nr:hypothetical protein [Natrarchaeobius chitinivorans]
MTDSTIDEKPGDGGFDVGSSADELFGEITEEPLEADVDREDPTESDDTAETGDDGIEDRTAASVFGQLKDEVGDSGTDELLEDETPDEIIASADEPDPEPEDPIDDDLLADDDELADLLLTGRTKGEEFLWIDADDSSTPTDSADPDDADVESDSSARLERADDVAAESADAPSALESDETRETESETDETPALETDDADESSTLEVPSGAESDESVSAETDSTAADGPADSEPTANPDAVGPSDEFDDAERESEPTERDAGDGSDERDATSRDAERDATDSEAERDDERASESERSPGLFARIRAKIAGIF